MTSEEGSICFDRAASFYDQTRALDVDATEKIQAQLLREIDGRRCLEIGVGTGRIALPLHRSGIPIVGLDLSGQMLATLVAKAGGSSPIPLVRGDATRLPFRDHAFDCAIASWVLHLIDGWRDVASELTRVVAPGGVLLIDLGSSRRHLSDYDKIKFHFRDVSGNTSWPRGPNGPEELDEHMQQLGPHPRSLPAVVETRIGTLEEDIQALEDGIYSVTWDVTPEVRADAASATRRWAEETIGSLTEQRSFEHTHEWRAYDVQ